MFCSANRLQVHTHAYAWSRVLGISKAQGCASTFLCFNRFGLGLVRSLLSIAGVLSKLATDPSQQTKKIEDQAPPKGFKLVLTNFPKDPLLRGSQMMSTCQTLVLTTPKGPTTWRLSNAVNLPNFGADNFQRTHQRLLNNVNQPNFVAAEHNSGRRGSETEIERTRVPA